MEQGIAFAMLVVLGWSFPGVFVRLMPRLDWLQATVMRLSVAFVVLLPLVLLHRGRRAALGATLRRPRAVGLAALMTTYYVTATAAFHHAPIGEVALLIASAPALAVLVNRLAGRRTSSTGLLGSIVAIAGVGVVALPAQLVPSKAPGYHPLGVLLALGAALCAALYAIGVAGMEENPGSLVLGTITFGLGALLLPVVPFAALAGYAPYLLGIGVVSTALPTIGYAEASDRLPRGMVTIFNPVVAVTANLAAALTLGELPSWWALPGGILVLVGVVLVLRPDTGNQKVA